MDECELNFSKGGKKDPKRGKSVSEGQNTFASCRHFTLINCSSANPINAVIALLRLTLSLVNRSRSEFHFNIKLHQTCLSLSLFEQKVGPVFRFHLLGDLNIKMVTKLLFLSLNYNC